MPYILRTFLASMALMTCLDGHASALYDYSVVAGGFDITGSFDAVASGNNLTGLTNFTIIVNGGTPYNASSAIFGANTSSAQVFSLTPGASDFLLQTNQLEWLQWGVPTDPYISTGYTSISGLVPTAADTSPFTIVQASGSSNVPEPATLFLAGAGLLGLFWSRRQFGRNQHVR